MITLFYILLMFITWMFFLAVMHLREIRDSQGFTKVNIIPAYTALIIGLILDFTLMLVMCIPLLHFTKRTVAYWQIETID